MTFQTKTYGTPMKIIYDSREKNVIGLLLKERFEHVYEDHLVTDFEYKISHSLNPISYREKRKPWSRPCSQVSAMYMY